MKNYLVGLYWLSLGVLIAVGVRKLVEYLFWMNDFPINIVIFNLIAGFFAGVVFSSLSVLKKFPPKKVFFSFGLLGALSTFSGYIFEIQQFMKEGRWIALWLFVILNNFGVFFAFVFGNKLSGGRR